MSNHRKADKKLIDTLKASLPRGYSRILADKHDCTPQYICAVINSGKITHPIWDSALVLLREDKIMLKKKQDKVCALLSS
jgi:hypothetical protein